MSTAVRRANEEINQKTKVKKMRCTIKNHSWRYYLAWAFGLHVLLGLLFLIHFEMQPKTLPAIPMMTTVVLPEKNLETFSSSHQPPPAKVKTPVEPPLKPIEAPSEILPHEKTNPIVEKSLPLDVKSPESKPIETKRIETKKIELKQEKTIPSKPTSIEPQNASPSKSAPKVSAPVSIDSYPSREAVSSTVTNDQSKEINHYRSLIVAAVSRYWILPPELNKKLKAVIVVRLGPGGVVLYTDIVEPSGYPLLEQSAITAINKASPLPVPDGPLFDEFRELRLTVKPEGILSERK